MTKIALGTLFGTSLLIAGAGPAMASTHDVNEYADTGWNTDYQFPYELRHNGDDIGFNVTTDNHLDMRWVTCDYDAYGDIVRNVYGSPQPAVVIGRNFRSGTCLYLQYRAHSGSLGYTGHFRGATYYNYNIV